MRFSTSISTAHTYCIATYRLDHTDPLVVATVLAFSEITDLPRSLHLSFHSVSIRDRPALEALRVLFLTSVCIATHRLNHNDPHVVVTGLAFTYERN